MNKFIMQDVTIEDKVSRLPFNTETNRQYHSRSQAADVIFKEIMSDEDNEKSPRSRFIERCISELEMTKAGSSTYFYNKVKKSKGGDEYEHNKNSERRKKEREKLAQSETSEEPKVEEKSTESFEIHRWRVVVKDTRQFVDSFTRRVDAQEFNRRQKQHGLQTVMVDGNKKSA